MTLLPRLLLKFLLFLILTFAFVVLFDHGPQGYGSAFLEQAKSLFQNLTNPNSAPTANFDQHDFEIDSLPPIPHLAHYGR